ncbi:MAG: toll/interleukin-1 receptor domain-containing protein [Steroidobacteraceae bacterium]
MVDIFISHSSQDNEWSNALHSELRQRLPSSTTYFLDSASLRAGDDWELKIDEEVGNAQHLVVLWSKAAKDSDWVHREINSYTLLARPMLGNTRRCVIINLEGQYGALNKTQQLVVPALQQAYPQASAVPAATWKDVARQIEDALNPNKTPLEVPLVVLSANKAQLDGLPVDRRTWIKDDYDLDYSTLLAQYDAKPSDWRPFSHSDSVATILESVRKQVNASLHHYLLSWKEPGPDFWTSTKAAKEFVESQFKTGELSVLIIDPVSLVHPDIYQRLMYFQNCLLDSRCVIVALPPFALFPGMIRLRAALQDRGSPYFDDYFQPIVPPVKRVAAQCCWNATDGDDIKRYILAAAGHIGHEPRAQSRSAFVSHGPPK